MGTRFGLNAITALGVSCLLVALAAVMACSQTVEVSVEVTREVTVEAEKPVEVTREVTVETSSLLEVTRQVTVEVEKPVEVTREVTVEVERPVTVEVTREVEVTSVRQVATAPATPTPTPTSTPEPQPTVINMESPMQDVPLSDFVDSGPYDVGMSELFFHDPERGFDGWNSVHASDAYQAMLRNVNDAGEDQIVATRIWYPVEAGTADLMQDFDSLFSTQSNVISQAYRGGLSWILGQVMPIGGGASSDISAPLAARVLNASWDAPIADGSFPVIIAAHGLGGNSLMWVSFARYLASRGYVVVGADFISDGSLPNVFDSPDSQYAQSADQREIDAAYRLIVSEQKVIPRFYDYFYDSNGRAAADGGARVGGMMGDFFTQRVGDVLTIIDGLDLLTADAAACASGFAERGQPNFAEAVCGRFADSIDTSKVGVMGHSLGSMTAQFAVARSDRVTAAVGYNNGPPRYWESEGIFGDGTAADGQPAGNPGPVMQIHGSEDAFVQWVFRGIMWSELSAAGGDPTDIWTLEQEQVLPTDENPQPIARNAYNRATGDKAIISVKDVTHGSLVENPTAEVISDAMPLVVDGVQYTARGEGPAQRKPVGQAVLGQGSAGGTFTPLGWGEVDGVQMHIPAFIRNYYTRSWFDYYLKGDESGLRFRDDPIPELGVLDVRSEIGN